MLGILRGLIRPPSVRQPFSYKTFSTGAVGPVKRPKSMLHWMLFGDPVDIELEATHDDKNTDS